MACGCCSLDLQHNRAHGQRRLGTCTSWQREGLDGASTERSRRALARQLREMLQREGVSAPLVTKCYEWMRDKNPEATRQMAAADGNLMSVQATHVAWSQQLQRQCTWASKDGAIDHELRSAIMDLYSLARRSRGAGDHDQEVQQLEALTLVAKWDSSDALPSKGTI